jgi:hypothetical protein
LSRHCWNWARRVERSAESLRQRVRSSDTVERTSVCTGCSHTWHSWLASVENDSRWELCCFRSFSRF